jgi:glycosyltransferase involved in cell wall biosynthesis
MKISVVIPAYNAARFLPRCVESVLAQTLEPEEIIVVDDGSKDDTTAVAQGLGVKVITQPNGGLSAARNTGMRHAKSDWIALLDADDLWAPEKLRLQANKVRDDTVLVYTGIRIFDDNGTRQLCLADPPSVTCRLLRYRNPIAPSSVLARRDEMTRDNGFREDIRACEDWEMWVRLMRLGKFEFVPEPVTDYYVYPGSMSADPNRMLVAMEQILEPTLVADLNGASRWAWRRRIRSAQLYSAALIARDNGLSGEIGYELRSLAAWPSPFWESQRFVGLGVTVRNKLRGRAGAR